MICGVVVCVWVCVLCLILCELLFVCSVVYVCVPGLLSVVVFGCSELSFTLVSGVDL